MMGFFFAVSCIIGIVLCCFGGSGSTLITCEQTDRVCFTAEMDVKYADVIVQRFIEQAGGTGSVFLLRGGRQIPYAEVSSNEESDAGQSV